MAQAVEPTLKILIIGPSNVGKSALLKRYCDDDFDPNDAAATIGIDYRVKRLSVRGRTYRVSLLDTAGQERFRTLSTSYYRGAHGILFVYDLTSRASFAQMDVWFDEAQANTVATSASAAAGPFACQYCLVAAKADRASTSRAVSAAEGRALAARYADGQEPLFFETSACTGDSVRDPFVALVDRIVTSGAADVPRHFAGGGVGGLVALDSGDGDQDGYLGSCGC